MAASVRITSHHTNVDDGSTADVAGGTVYMKQVGDSDNNSSGVTGAGTNYSLIKNLRVYVNTTPIHRIDNLKFFWTGTQVTNIDMLGKISTTYVDPVANGTTALTAVTSMYTYTTIAPLSQDGQFVVGTDTAPKFIGFFLVMQLKTTGAAVVSDVNVGSLITRYDES